MISNFIFESFTLVAYDNWHTAILLQGEILTNGRFENKSSVIVNDWLPPAVP